MKTSRIEPVIAVLFLSAVTGFGLYHFGQCIYRLWFFSSDEYVLAGEVIRFVQRDFRQHFFDMPGTPYIVLCALLWAAGYLLAVLTGAAEGLPIAHFTFDHLPQLFYLMRAVTLFFYFLSLGLTYALARRLTNTGGAMAATLLLSLSIPYASYSSFARVESLALCLILGALLLILRLLDRAPAGWADSADPWPWMLRFAGVGVLIGWAGAVRLHSLTLTIPLLFLIFAARSNAAGSTRSRWVRYIWLIIALFAGASCIVLWVAPEVRGEILRRTFTTFSAAVRLARSAALGTLCISAVIWYSYRSLRWNGLATRWASPEISSLAVGVVAGLGSGLFPLATQGMYLASSMQAYSTSYIDRARALLPLADNIRQYLTFYKEQFAPDAFTATLATVGMLWIAVERRKALLPFLASALLFFVSKPLNLVAASHHVILWLPCWYLCAAFPVARLWQWRKHTGPALACLLMGALAWTAPNGAVLAGKALPAAYDSRRNIEHATEWIESRAKPNDVVAISYFCFNKHVFFEWIRQLDVPIPASRMPDGKVLIWWGHRRRIEGREGFACTTPGDVESIKYKLDLAEPGQGTDPYRDKGFRREATFGHGGAQVDVFRFDLRHRGSHAN